ITNCAKCRSAAWMTKHSMPWSRRFSRLAERRPIIPILFHRASSVGSRILVQMDTKNFDLLVHVASYTTWAVPSDALSASTQPMDQWMPVEGISDDAVVVCQGYHGIRPRLGGLLLPERAGVAFPAFGCSLDAARFHTPRREREPGSKGRKHST